MKQALFGAVVCVCVATAQGAVSSRAAVQAPQIVVTDLNPHDDIPAAWIEGGYRASVFHAELHPAPLGDETEGDGRLDIDAEGIGGSATQGRYFAVRDLYLPSFTLRLTPYTRFDLTVPFRLDLDVDAATGPGGALPFGHASVELSLLAIDELVPLEDGLDFDHGPPYYRRDFVVLESTMLSPAFGTRWLDGSLSVQFDNLSAGEAVLAFRAELVSFGESAPPSAVPEAGPAALWLTGALALAWRRRRVRCKSA